MCRGGTFNLSYESVGSRACRDALKALKTTDPDFFRELTQSEVGESEPVIDESTVVPEDNMEHGAHGDYEDDTNVPAHILGKAHPNSQCDAEQSC